MAASIRDIKQKVVATKKTSQITNAMNMVSASKLKGAQKTAQSFIPYMQRIEDIIINLASNAEELEHPLLNEREGNKTCYILITSDRMGRARDSEIKIWHVYGNHLLLQYV